MAWPQPAAATGENQFFTSGGSDSNSSDQHEPATFVADVVSYDDAKGLVIASGHVEIANSQHVLLADKVVYDKNSEQLAAEGNVVLYEAGGQVIFNDKMQLTSDMKDGFMTGVGVSMVDNSRLTAPAGERFSGRWLRLYDGTYTPYPPDPDHPDRPPLWQLDSGEIIHDNVSHDLVYHDAWLDAFGYPVLYTPYISTPDPTVKRRTGFLTPLIGFGGNFGANVRAPYYYDLEPETDLTITPWVSSDDGLQMDALLRHRFTDGFFNFETSGVDTNNVNSDGSVSHDVFRGHIQSNGILDFENGWRVGETALLSTDDSYLVRYNYSGAATLTNRLYAENFSGRDYFVANSYYFQNTIPGTPEQPLVEPSFDYMAYGRPGDTLGGRWSFESGLLNIAHDDSTSTDFERASMAGGWERKLYSDVGLVTTLDADMRDDIYFTHNLADANNADGVTNDVVANRFFPSAEAMLAYPLARRVDSYQQTIEPEAALFAAPVPRNEYLIPNVDSQGFELDATDIFEPNGFSGVDRIEGGSRVIYGMKTGVYGDGGGGSTFFLGQSYNIQTDPSIPVDSGIDGHISDIVGQFQIYPSDLFIVDYNFRLSEQTLDPDLHELDIIAGNRRLRAAVDYLYIAGESNAEEIDDGTREQVTYGLNGEITDRWTASAAQTIDLTGEGILTTSLRLIYDDQGMTTSVTANINNTDRTGVNNGAEILFQISFKGLGGQQLQPFDPGVFGGLHATSLLTPGEDVPH